MLIDANSWGTALTFTTTVIIFVAAIISIVGSIIQLRANVVAAKTNMGSPAQADASHPKIRKMTDKNWPLKYFWRKQKFSLLVALILFWLPFFQAKLAGTTSVSFIFIMVHSTIMFYGLCYFLLKIAAFELAEETRKSRGAKD